MAEQVMASPFGVRFSEAIDFLKGKLPESSVAWDSLAGPVHAKVFTVAGATSADLARDLQASLVGALQNGTTITQFRKDFDATVQQHGWSYKGKRGWRTGIIFDTNMRTAHMAGRWAQLQANKDRRPFLQYRTAGDSRVRPQHRQWNGLVFHIDHDFWQTHYPPCGWACRCTVRAYGQGEVEEKNLQVSKTFDMKLRDVRNADGELLDRVPVGIDPGWDHNVGQSWISPELALGQKLARLPRELQGLLVDKTISPAFQTVLTERWKAFRAEVAATKRPKDVAQVIGYLDSAMLGGMSRVAPELELDSTMVGAFDNKTNHLAGKHKPRKVLQIWPSAWIDDLPMHLRNYRAVFWDTTDKVLLVVPQGAFNERLPKMALRPNVPTKFGKAWELVSLGSAQAENFGQNRYVLLIGTLD